MAKFQVRGRVNKDQPVSGLTERLINLALVPLVLALLLVAFFALQEVLLTVSARVIVKTMDSTVRGTYALATVRNFWLLGGGAILVGVLIYVLDYAFKHWRTQRFRRLALRIVALTLVIIALQWIVTA